MHVPCRGGGPASLDASPAQALLFMSNLAIISGHIRTGTLRSLGVTTTGEIRHVPGVKNFAQQDAGGCETPIRWALRGQIGKSLAILRCMEEAVQGTLADAEGRPFIEEQGTNVATSEPDPRGGTNGRIVALAKLAADRG